MRASNKIQKSTVSKHSNINIFKISNSIRYVFL